MTISEAKRIRIIDYLQQLGHKPQYIKHGEYWYLSPLRQEKTPSFSVNDRLNVWYDFGEAAGGDLVELGKYLYQTENISQILSHIEVHARNPAVSRVFTTETGAPPVERLMKKVMVAPLRHNALLSYLRTRHIDTEVGQMFCCEVHYELRRRHYFGIAFGNMSGGYEVRNPYYKGCIERKDITLIRHQANQRQRHVCVFEGFMDFLSYLTMMRRENNEICIAYPADHIVMNSISNLGKTLMQLGEYKHIHCYLDNDLAGQKTVETIASLYEGRVTDESSRYSEYKDLNDCIRDKKR